MRGESKRVKIIKIVSLMARFLKEDSIRGQGTMIVSDINTSLYSVFSHGVKLT